MTKDDETGHFFAIYDELLAGPPCRQNLCFVISRQCFVIFRHQKQRIWAN